MAISAHGIVITRNGVAIPELHDVELPALLRRPIEDSRHNRDDEDFAASYRQYGELSFGMAMVSALADLITAWSEDSLDDYEITFPDGAVWSFSGLVIDVSSRSPVDGLLEAQVTIRSTGEINLLGDHSPSIELESEGFLLQESEGRLLL